MKRIITLVLPIALLICGCEKTPDNPDTGNGEFTATGWNGYYVEAMASAYGYFLENDKMPSTINVEAIDFDRGEYIAAGCVILKKIKEEPDTWQDNEADFIDVPAPSSNANNTIDKDEMTLDEFMTVLDNNYDYAVTNNRFANYCTVESEHTDPDGSQYSTKLTINAFAVMLARIFDYFAENNVLPETISTWHSDFLRETKNCEVTSPVVIAEMEKAIGNATTDYDKAKAIFEYARDEWEYENYYNTTRGAVKTIEDKAGNCCDLTHGIVAMARAAGIPSRYRHAQCMYSSGVIGHVMAELYVDGVWYLCDASNNNNTFGNHEAWSYMETFNGRFSELDF